MYRPTPILSPPVPDCHSRFGRPSSEAADILVWCTDIYAIQYQLRRLSNVSLTIVLSAGFLQPRLELQGFIERKAELRMRHKDGLQPQVVVLCSTVSDLIRVQCTTRPFKTAFITNVIHCWKLLTFVLKPHLSLI